MGKIQDGRHLSKIKQYIDIFFNTIEADYYIYVYYRVLRYARHSGDVGKYLVIALLVKNLRWPQFPQDQAINSYHFRHNKGGFVFLVSVMGFSGMPYKMVLSENILDIALWVKNPRWLLFVKGRSIKLMDIIFDRIDAE